MEPTMLTEKITQWLDGELNQAEIAELQSYLAQHPDQNETYQAVQRADRLLRATATTLVEPEPGFTTRFERRLAGYKPQKVWRLWAGLSVLLVGALIFLTIGFIVGGVTLLSLWSTLIDTRLLYYGLNLLGQTINQTQTWFNLAGFFLKIALIAADQPLFWISAPVAGVLGWLWLRLLKTPPQRLTTNMEMIL